MKTVPLFQFILLIIFAFCSFTEAACPSEEKEPWSYNTNLKNGPAYWGEININCFGYKQSPINIRTSDVKKNKTLGKLQLKNYDKPVTKFKLENNGHTVKVIPDDDVPRSVVINGVTYQLDHLHFHWGDKYFKGSEHTVNDRQYRMELHFVHYDRDGYVAVVGMFYRDALISLINLDLSKIANSLKEVPYKGDNVTLVTKLRLDKLFKKDCSYYRYIGSLTTPGCNQDVIWSLCKEPFNISPSQIAKFKKLYSAEKNNKENIKDCKITNNFRPTQPLNDRVVQSSS